MTRSNEDRSERQLSYRAQCPDGTCVPSRSGGFCLLCGRALRRQAVPEDVLQAALTQQDEEREPLDPNDPNYWIYLMHEIEIIAEPIAPPTNAGLAFFGKRPARMAS
jgi:hypothetical protein